MLLHIQNLNCKIKKITPMDRKSRNIYFYSIKKHVQVLFCSMIIIKQMLLLI